MCSEQERQQRISVNKRHVAELIMGNVDEQFQMIKKYERSSADKELNIPEILRSPFVLHETVEYLLKVVNQISNIDRFEIFEFI